MSERNLDFETVIDRRGTKSLKYDFAKERGIPEDTLPLWVADMDFRVSSYIEDALTSQALHAIYGYTEVDDDFFEVQQKWIKEHYHREVKREWFHKAPGVIFSLTVAINSYTEEGDAILINQPVYYPFMSSIRDNKRIIVSSDLIKDENGYYSIDFDDLEEKIKLYHPKLYVLCSPHNPVGRVWNKDELNRIGNLCKKYGVIVFSDEIHADFVWDKEFVTFTNAGEGFDDFTITAFSPSKTFNIAGLQVSSVIIKNKFLYKKFADGYKVSGYSQINAAGIVAAQAAYQYGEEWYTEVKKVINSNLDYAVDFINTRLPGIKVRKPEGTYLLWLDFSEYGFSERELKELITYKAKLWLDSGRIFGKTGYGFERINVAVPRKTLKEALERLEKALVKESFYYINNNKIQKRDVAV